MTLIANVVKILLSDTDKQAKVITYSTKPLWMVIEGLISQLHASTTEDDDNDPLAEQVANDIITFLDNQ